MTTRTKKQPKVDPEAMYVAWDAAYIEGHNGAGYVVQMGKRLRGSNRAVQKCPWLFLPDGTPDDEIANHRAREYVKEEAAARASAPPEESGAAVPEPVADEDLVVAIREVTLGVSGGLAVGPKGEGMAAPAGTRLAKSHPLVKADRDGFASVTNGIPRHRAVVAQEQVSTTDESESTRTIHAGQWADQDDPLVRINPVMFKRPDW
jgi:hypothetical protein